MRLRPVHLMRLPGIRAALAATAAALLLAACQKSSEAPEPPRAGVTHDAAMAKAIEQARSTLDEFLKRVQSPPPGASGFAVKVGVREAQTTEYLWINRLTWTGDQFSGVVMDPPQAVKAVKQGQNLAFVRADIVDWSYQFLREGRTVGNFTLCALLTREPPAKAAELRERFGLDCRFLAQ